MFEIIDALYGPISLEVKKEALIVPELQRLRSIRLCNVNSPYITGGDGLNRFEHAIGTAYIAQEIIKNYKVNMLDREAFVLASLYHDIVTSSFGHSLEYLFESVTGDEYEHANIWLMFLSGKTIQTSRPIYYDHKFSLNTVVEHKTIERISEILSGQHELSALLANEIDIDNIDNVYRFAYHIGIDFDRDLPLNLSKSLRYVDGKISANDDTIRCLSDWFNVREKLYIYLLENVGEFSAKALLERVFIESIKDGVISIDDWILTDSEIIHLMFKKGNKIVRNSIQRLMTMNFYNYFEVMMSVDYEIIDLFLKKNKISLIDEVFSNSVLVHFIRDVNKTRRVLKVFNESASEEVEIGKRNDRYLVGFFSENQSKLRDAVKFIEESIHINLVKTTNNNDQQKQRTLF